jgi:lipoprotein-anchoring transpeptidase ErfK/SrfK
VEEEATEAVASADEAGEAEGEEEEEPEDAGPPTLRDLRGNRNSILMRRMMKGFYVSLDRDFRANRRRYWRTQQHEFIPYRMLNLKSGSEFQGIELGPLATVRPGALSGTDTDTDTDSESGTDTGSDTATDTDTDTDTAAIGLPVGFVLSRDTSSYRVTDDGRVRRNARKPGYHYTFHVVGEHEYRGERYFLGDDGNAYRERDITVAERIDRPEDVGEDEKWIDVNLSDQTMVAYQGDTPVYATLVSTGIIIREGVPGQDHRTAPGRYRIRAKHLATTMDGYNAFDGAYSIEDVPYVMYYEAGYALHSAFWHNLFGRTKSHGCVNLSPRDAKWMFGWTEPALPEGWHGVYPEDPEEGTLIVIRGETPQRRRRR